MTDVVSEPQGEVETGPVKTEKQKIMDIQAIVKLARYNPFWIDGVWKKESHKGIRSYLIDNKLPEDMSVNALWEHLNTRLDTDQQFRTQVYMSAAAAVGEQAKMSPELIELKKAAQVLFNLEGFSGAEPLVIDGDATFNDGSPTKTFEAGQKVREFLKKEQDAETQQDATIGLQEKELAEARSRIAQLEAENQGLGAQILEQQREIGALRMPETTAARIAEASPEVRRYAEKDRHGTLALTQIFEKAAAGGVLDAMTAEKNGRFLREQFKAAAAYHDVDQGKELGFTPKVGDVVFYGFGARRVGIIESMDEQTGDLVYKDAEGKSHTINMRQAESMKEKGLTSGAYFKALGIDGFGDTSDLARFAEEAKAITELAAESETLEPAAAHKPSPVSAGQLTV